MNKFYNPGYCFGNHPTEIESWLFYLNCILASMFVSLFVCVTMSLPHGATG